MDYGFSAHRRTIPQGISGFTKSGEKVVISRPVYVQENRKNGKLDSVTVLTGKHHNAKATVRIVGDTARY